MFLHLDVLTAEEVSALRKCVYEGLCGELVEMLRFEVLAQKHDVHRHFSEALSRVYIEMGRLADADPLCMIDAFGDVKERLQSAIFPTSSAPQPKLKVSKDVKPDLSVLEWKTVVCPRCRRKGLIKPLQRKRGYNVRIVYYCYHKTKKKRCYLKMSDRLELKKRLDAQLL